MQTAAKYIDLAIKQAILAAKEGEVPIGAVFVVKNYPKDGDFYMSAGRNKVYKKNSNINHAEVVAINKLCKKLKITNFANIDATLYCTLEPCVMCCGFIGLCNIQRVIFGLRDEKFGFITNCSLNGNLNGRYNFDYFYELLPSQSVQIKQIMNDFFKPKR